jgi:1-acyl-sn-glycerol-3-phosphate acyltransferase
MVNAGTNPPQGYYNQMIENLLYQLSKPIVKTYSGTMLDMDVQWHEQMPAGPKIIAPNHPSTTDPFFVATLFTHQVFILINEKLFKVPVFGKYLRKSGHIPVVVGKGQAALDEALQRLADGFTVVIFPEGALSPREGGFCEPRTGAARLALQSGAPIVPVGLSLNRDRVHSIISHIEGQEEEGRWYFRGPYKMTVGRPIFFRGDVENHSYVRQVSKAIMQHIQELAFQSDERMQQGPTAFPLPEIY